MISPEAIHYAGEIMDILYRKVFSIALLDARTLNDFMKVSCFGFPARSSWLDMKLTGNTRSGIYWL